MSVETSIEQLQEELERLRSQLQKSEQLLEEQHYLPRPGTTTMHTTEEEEACSSAHSFLTYPLT